VSHHRTEAERLLELIDTANLAPGDLATVVLAHAVLAVDDSIIEGRTAINAAAESITEAIPIG
jgi:hypothetical protein